MDREMDQGATFQGKWGLRALFAWASRRFANRIALAAVSVTMVLLAVVGSVSYLATKAMVLDNVHQRLGSQADLTRQYLELHINGAASSLKSLAGNTLMGNALTDSLGRDIYLQPFLRDFRLPTDVPFRLTLCDFEGKGIADNTTERMKDYRNVPWLSQVIERGRPYATIFHSGSHSPHLMIVQPVLFPATSLPEGALVLEVDLQHFYWPAVAFLPKDANHWLEHGEYKHYYSDLHRISDLQIVERRELALQSPLSGMHLSVAMGEPHETILLPLKHLSVKFMVAGVLLLLVAGILAIKISAHLTRSLTQLSVTAQEVANKGVLSLRLPVRGMDETAIMADSFNRMIERLEKSYNTLEEKVEMRTEELRQARDEAESANRAKSDFLASMSHEIRTPMNTILGIGELLQESPRLSPRERQFLTVSRRAGESLMSLINDILDFSKIEVGQLHMEEVIFDPGGEARHALDVILGNGVAGGVQLACVLDPHLPTQVRGDPQRLRQILLNLLSNAAKFTSTGHITLQVSPLPEERLLFVVEDTGIGIAEERLEHIFQPFTQAESSTTRRFGGTGLGLTICRQLVARMGGEIQVESKLGKGSTFRVTVHLPWSDQVDTDLPYQGTEAVILPSARGDDAGPGLNILLVDDIEDNRLVVGAFLDKTPHRIRQAASGEEAVQCFMQERFDLVLMDIQMPEMDGHEATRRMRTLEAERGLTPTPIVALTANAMKEDVERTLRAGCDDHLSKPVRRSSLLQVIARYSSAQGGEAPPVAQSLPATGAGEIIHMDVLTELQNEAEEGFPLILSTFLSNLPERLKDLAAAVDREDRPAIKMAAHKLKGISATFGAGALAALCASLEQMSEGDTPKGDYEETLAEVMDKAMRTQTELNAVLANSREND